MQGRSWMAALTLNASALLGLALGIVLPDASRAEDARSNSPQLPAGTAAPDAGAAQSFAVQLNLDIAGVGPKGCDVEIAPAHMGCQFRPVSLHVSPRDANRGKILFKDIQTAGEDRYCLFAITIREPGQPVRTARRGLRLVAPKSAHSAPQLLFCYLSSPSKLARTSEMRERR